MATSPNENQNEKEYSIPITWMSYTRVKVKAPNLQEAIKEALRKFLNTPDENYLEDSFEIDSIIDDEYPDETYDIGKALEEI